MTLPKLDISLLLRLENNVTLSTTHDLKDIPSLVRLIDLGYIEPELGRTEYAGIGMIILAEKGKQYLETFTATEKIDIIIETYITAPYLVKYFNQLTIDELPKYLTSTVPSVRQYAQVRALSERIKENS